MTQITSLFNPTTHSHPSNIFILDLVVTCLVCQCTVLHSSTHLKKEFHRALNYLQSKYKHKTPFEFHFNPRVLHLKPVNQLTVVFYGKINCNFRLISNRFFSSCGLSNLQVRHGFSTALINFWDKAVFMMMPSRSLKLSLF